MSLFRPEASNSSEMTKRFAAPRARCHVGKGTAPAEPHQGASLGLLGPYHPVHNPAQALGLLGSQCHPFGDMGWWSLEMGTHLRTGPWLPLQPEAEASGCCVRGPKGGQKREK